MCVLDLVSDPCDTYATLTDLWRQPEADADLNHCDTMAEGWYTFLLGDKDQAKIPTQCLQVRQTDRQTDKPRKMDGFIDKTLDR